MKRIVPFIIAVLCFSASFQSAHAQQPAHAQDTVKVDHTLKGQYQLMLSKSKTLGGYKVVNPSRLSSFWQNLRDTLTTERKQLIQAKTKITAQEKSINTLKTQITDHETSIANINTKLNEISFLGIQFTKPVYNITVWTLIILLALALTFVVIRSAKHIHEAKYRSTLYDEISQEYQNYKTKANDKEKKLARELQDERNKLEEFKSRNR